MKGNGSEKEVMKGGGSENEVMKGGVSEKEERREEEVRRKYEGRE